VPSKIKFIPGAGEIIRAVGISALAIALAVYVMVRQEQQAVVVAMGAIVLLVLTSAMLQVSRAVRRLHRQQHETRQAALRAERHYFKVLRRVMAALEAREPYTRGRSKRIGYFARRIAEQLGLSHDECRLLDMAGQVHDIGLLGVPDRVLNKPARLGTAEYRNIKKHSAESIRILQPLTFLADVLPAIHYHHERMNGTGYPHGMAGEEIPLAARILAVSDAYDAMTHDRPHRAALPPFEALGELWRCAPAGYDTDCIAALEEVMQMRHLRRAHAASAPADATPAPAQTPQAEPGHLIVP
jgi:HD-GYP domain-containing protein (c-di-GMP phosphodiesterase class II)